VGQTTFNPTWIRGLSELSWVQSIFEKIDFFSSSVQSTFEKIENFLNLTQFKLVMKQIDSRNRVHF